MLDCFLFLELELQVVELQEVLLESRHDGQQARQDLEQLEQEYLLRLQKEKAENENMKQKYDKLSQAHDMMKKSLENQKLQHETLMSELRRERSLRKKAEDGQADLLASLSDQDQLRMSLHESNQRVAAESVVREGLKVEIDDLRRTSAILEDEIRERVRREDELSARIAELKAGLDEAESRRVETLTEKEQSFKHFVGERAVLEKRVHAEECKVQRLEQVIRLLKSTQLETSETLDSVKRELQASRKSFGDATAASKLEKTTSQEQLAKKEAEIKDLRGWNEVLKSELESAENQIDDLHREVDKLMSQSEHQDKLLKSTQDAAAACELEKTVAQEQLAENEEEMKNLWNHNEALQLDLESAKSRVDYLQQEAELEKTAAREQLGKKHGEVTDLRDCNEALKVDLDTAKSQVEGLQREVVKLASQLEHQDELLRKLEKEKKLLWGSACDQPRDDTMEESFYGKEDLWVE